MFRGKKTEQYRETRALLLIGAIMECDTLSKLFDTGNEESRMMAEFHRARRAVLTQHLRKL